MSDTGEHMDDLIRDGFNAQDEGFDFGSWDALEKKIEGNSSVDEKVLAAFGEIPQEMPVGGWTGIEEQLDIDTVWTRIDAKLSKKRRAGFIWWHAAAIGILLLLGGSLVHNKFYSSSESTETPPNHTTEKTVPLLTDSGTSETQSTSGNNDSKSNINSTSAFYEDGLGTITGGEENINANGNSNVDLGADQGRADTGSDHVGISFASNNQNIDLMDRLGHQEGTGLNNMAKTSISPIQFTQVKPISLRPEFGDSPLIKITPLEDENCSLRPRKWVAGLFASVDNSFVSDATAREGFSKTSLVSNNFVLSANYGAYGQLYFKNGYFLSSQFYLNSRSKRSSQQYIGFENLENLVVIDYYKVTAAFGKSFNLGSKCSGNAINASAGLFGALLKQEFSTLGGEEFENAHDHRKLDYGLHFELGYQKEINHFVFGAGIHSSIGLNNIFDPEPKQSAFLNRSKIYTNGLYFKFGYKF